MSPDEANETMKGACIITYVPIIDYVRTGSNKLLLKQNIIANILLSIIIILLSKILLRIFQKQYTLRDNLAGSLCFAKHNFCVFSKFVCFNIISSMEFALVITFYLNVRGKDEKGIMAPTYRRHRVVLDQVRT